MTDKLLLRKRSIIETINGQLKNISQIEYSRHRSLDGFMLNLLAGLVAYTHQTKKPSIYHNDLPILQAVNQKLYYRNGYNAKGNVRVCIPNKESI